MSASDLGTRPLSCGWLRSFSIGITAALLAFGMIYYHSGVLLPIRQKSVQGSTSKGNWSDLYSAWVGTREAVRHRRNPYSAEVTREIQLGFYGAVVDPANPQHMKNPQSFV